MCVCVRAYCGTQGCCPVGSLGWGADVCPYAHVSSSSDEVLSSVCDALRRSSVALKRPDAAKSLWEGKGWSSSMFGLQDVCLMGLLTG